MSPRHNSEASLPFLHPDVASEAERRLEAEILWPVYTRAGHPRLNVHSRRGPPSYRNILAWYLRASGMTGTEIGEFLGMSSSRANQIAQRIQSRFLSPWNIASMVASAKSDGIPPGRELDAHLLMATRFEMWAAEDALARCSQQDIYAVSAALRIGRERYASAYEAVAGATCACRLCGTLADNRRDTKPYWLEEDQSAAPAPAASRRPE